MADQSSGEKTEEATPKKLQDARKKGQIWKSRDMTSAVVFVTGMSAILLLAPFILGEIEELFGLGLSKIGQDITEDDITQLLYEGLIAVVYITVPVAMAGAVLGAFSDFFQVGALFSIDPVMPKLEKVNPIEGLKNLFSAKKFVELIKSTLMLCVAGYVAYGVVTNNLGTVASTARADAQSLFQVVGALSFELIKKMGMVLVALSIFDLWWQHRVYKKDQRMTKDEVKREFKDSEGDPHHKAKRKEMHQEILESAAIEEVANADVIITNPTHYAVALRYDRAVDSAPRVVAKGVGARAAQIRKIAAEAEVPMMRNVPLAHALYRVELGQEIPEQLYDAVAEVLNFVYAEARRREGELG